MVEPWLGVEREPGEWRTWRAVVSIAVTLVITVAAAVDLAQPAWVLIGLIGPSALVVDGVARRHRRRAVR